MITTTTLDCGMPLICERIPGVQSASLHWLLPAGAGRDPADRQGLAPMFAELLLRGAGQCDSRQQADEFDRLGLLRSVDVGTQYLRISATFVAARTTEVVGPLAEMVLHPHFHADALEPSRHLCLQSLAGLADNPQERAGVILNQRHAQVPLNRSALGTEEGLTAITRQDVVDGWQRQAKPGGSIFAVAGHIEPSLIEERLNSLLRAWKGAAPALITADPPARGTYHHENDASNQVHIYLAHEGPPESSPDARLERMINAALCGGTSARLFTEVREKRALCYSVSAGYHTDKFYGRTVGYVGTTPDKAQQSLDVFLEQLRLLTGPAAAVAKDEFDRARIGFKSRLVSSGESTSARAAALASDYHRLRRARSLQELTAEVEAVTLDQLNAYAKRRQMGPITIVTLGPAALKA